MQSDFCSPDLVLIFLMFAQQVRLLSRDTRGSSSCPFLLWRFPCFKTLVFRSQHPYTPLLVSAAEHGFLHAPPKPRRDRDDRNNCFVLLPWLVSVFARPHWSCVTISCWLPVLTRTTLSGPCHLMTRRTLSLLCVTVLLPPSLVTLTNLSLLHL